MRNNGNLNPKRKGNSEERKQAKQLSLWMFGDPDVLKRHSTSGADKSVYVGDVIPIKQLQNYGWKKFPFMIEIKTGYKENIPTFWSYDKILLWYKKAKKECEKTNQNIILLICQFKNRSALLITNKCLEKIPFTVCIPAIVSEYDVEYAFVYILKDVLKISFKEIFNYDIYSL